MNIKKEIEILETEYLKISAHREGIVKELRNAKEKYFKLEMEKEGYVYLSSGDKVFVRMDDGTIGTVFYEKIMFRNLDDPQIIYHDMNKKGKPYKDYNNESMETFLGYVHPNIEEEA